MEKVRDTEAAVGSDVMTAALATYHVLLAAGGERLDELTANWPSASKARASAPNPQWPDADAIKTTSDAQ